MKKTMILTLISQLPLLACEREPKDYNDCILKKVKSGMNEKAVVAIQWACAEKFTVPEEPTQSLGSADLALLEGKGDFPRNGQFRATLYNGSDFTLKEIGITVTVTHEGEESKERLYRAEVDLSPRSAGEVVFNVMDENVWSDFLLSTDLSPYSPFRWRITEAKGAK